MRKLCAIVVLWLLLVGEATCVHRWQTVYQKLTQEKNLSQFYSLLQENKVSKSHLFYREVTIFAPTNDAFRKFTGSTTQNLTNYHITHYAYTMKDLVDTYLESVQQKSPPLWIKRHLGDVFVNNALILDDLSDFVSKSRPDDTYGRRQILHVIDEVLDPFVQINPTAYDVLGQTNLWTTTYSVRNFFSKVIQNHAEILFGNEGSFTFFLPIDQGLDEYRMQMIDPYIVKAHIVPNQVLFTRPSPKNYPFETLADADYICILVSIDEEGTKITAKSITILGDANHRVGEIKAEVVFPNIPVKNGVVHLINRPFGVFDRILTKFPYLPVLDKLSMDPTLNVTYNLALKSAFVKYFKNPRKKFTLFVPRDSAWRKFRNLDSLEPGKIKTILNRHLVLDDLPLTLDRLYRASNRTCVQLTTPSGSAVCLAVARNEDKFYVKWNRRYIEVYRGDYECSDGIVHVIDHPFVSTDDIQPESKSVSFVQMWEAIQRLIL